MEFTEADKQTLIKLLRNGENVFVLNDVRIPTYPWDEDEKRFEKFLQATMKSIGYKIIAHQSSSRSFFTVGKILDHPNEYVPSTSDEIETVTWAEKAFKEFRFPIDKFLSNGYGTPKERYEYLRDSKYSRLLLYGGDLEKIKLLIHDTRNKITQDHLHLVVSWACACDYDRLVLLAQHPHYHPELHHNMGIYTAVNNPDHRCLEFLLRDSRVNPADKEHRALVVATCDGKIVHVKLLIDAYRQQQIPFPDALVATLKAIANGENYRFDPEIHHRMSHDPEFHRGERNEELITLFEQIF